MASNNPPPASPLINKGHQHEFTIPVEWKDFTQQSLTDGAGTVTLVYSAHSVTKLRCICGKEVSRE